VLLVFVTKSRRYCLNNHFNAVTNTGDITRHVAMNW